MDFETMYNAKDAQPFDQKNEMFKRARWEEKFRWAGKRYYGMVEPKEKPGFRIEDMALRNAAWWLEFAYARGIDTSNYGIFSWENKRDSIQALPEDAKFDPKDPEYNARVIKKAAKIFGADLVGICKLDRRWIYTKGFKFVERKEYDIDVPDEYQYVINMAVEMPYEALRYSPTYIGGGGTGVGYSLMAYVAGLVAQFLRQLGYKAIPSGNDTAMSVPYAIQAGLGELGRLGQVITYEFGPRVRLCKVFTNLPLKCDEPIRFGATEFCESCKKCAENCPSQAISYEPKRSTEPNNKSNAGGSLKWYINAEKCFEFWAKNYADCGNCIRVCPFNKPKGLLHTSVKWMVDYLPQFNRPMKWADDLFGYARQLDAATFWDR
jgi:reductive dehalogenase